MRILTPLPANKTNTEAFRILICQVGCSGIADHRPMLTQATRLRMPSAIIPLSTAIAIVLTLFRHVRRLHVKSPCRYYFEYPTGWKTDVINKTQKGTQGIDCRIYNPRNKSALPASPPVALA